MTTTTTTTPAVQNLANRIAAPRNELSRTDFISMCKQLRGAKIITLVSNVEPKIKKPKTSGMEGRIRKRSHVNCIIGFHYANAVNNQRMREAAPLMDHPLVKAGVATVEVEHFEALPRKWGTRIDGTPLVENKGKFYLEVKVEKVYDTEYLLDGVVVDKEAIASHLVERDGESARQGTEKAIILRDYAVDSLESITVNGETYFLVE